MEEHPDDNKDLSLTKHGVAAENRGGVFMNILEARAPGAVANVCTLLWRSGVV